MANALTLLVRKVDAMASAVRTTIPLPLSSRKKFALTICVCKERAVSRWQMP